VKTTKQDYRLGFTYRLQLLQAWRHVRKVAAAVAAQPRMSRHELRWAVECLRIALRQARHLGNPRLLLRLR